MKVTIICISTLCGKISPVANLGSKIDRKFLEKTRENTDASLIGASSLRSGDPEFRNSKGQIPPNRIRAVITNSGNIPLNKKIFLNGPKPIIFCSTHLYNSLKPKIDTKAKLISLSKLSDGSLDLKQMLSYLKDLGVQHLLIEGGGQLNYYSLKQRIVDELLITLAPKILGKKSEADLINGDFPLGDPFLELKLVSCNVSKDTGEIFLRYRIPK